MQCPNCNATLDNDAVFCGNCGRQIAPIQAQGATIAEGAHAANPASRGPVGASFGVSEPTNFSGTQTPSDPATKRYGTQTPSEPPTAQHHTRGETNVETQLIAGTYDQQGERMTPPTIPMPLPGRTPPHARPGSMNTRMIVFIALIIVLLVAGISGGVYALTHNGKATTTTTTTNTGIAQNATALVSFTDSQAAFAETDTLKITANRLPDPAAGSHYQAWLLDDATEQITALGPLVPQGDQTFTVSFTQKNVNLIGAGNKVEITQEKSEVTVPQGTIFLQGLFPPAAFVHIRHLLFHFDVTPNHVGLVVGLREQSQSLNSQAALLQSFSKGGNPTAISCAAQSIINIIEGKNGAHFQNLAAACANFSIADPADGFGLLGTGGYAAVTSQHAALAANQADSTDNIKLHAKHVEVSTDDVTSWSTMINDNALALLNHTGDAAREVQKITKLANQVLNGVDINGNETVDPIPNEAGAITAYIHAQFMALLSLAPPK